jgi:hypothetical protein
LLTESVGAIAGAGAVTALGALVGAGGAGVIAGNYLANHTEVGGDTVGAVGAIDKFFGGDPEHGKSAVVDMDDRRQQEWAHGGIEGTLAAAGLGVAEGAIGTAAAVGGLVEGAVHGEEWIGKKIAGLF